MIRDTFVYLLFYTFPACLLLLEAFIAVPSASDSFPTTWVSRNVSSRCLLCLSFQHVQYDHMDYASPILTAEEYKDTKFDHDMWQTITVASRLATIQSNCTRGGRPQRNLVATCKVEDMQHISTVVRWQTFSSKETVCAFQRNAIGTDQYRELLYVLSRLYVFARSSRLLHSIGIVSAQCDLQHMTS